MTCSTMDVEDVHQVLSVMQKNLECPICLDLMKEPVATRCDHIFCRFCMLQLLSRKKKSRAQCPMCKKEVTKRSLQDSPRFKLLVDGLLKIINAFELDSGYKFFPSQDYASTVTASNKEAPKKEEQAVVQSTGHRNRTKRGRVSAGDRKDHLSLLETVPDTQPPRNSDTRNRKQPKRQKNGIKELIDDFVSDSSEDDLFKKAGSVGSDVDSPSVPCEPKVSPEPEEEDDLLMGNEANDQVSSKLESEDVVASDLGEVSGCESEASHTGDSSGLSSQCEILTSQQRDAMRNNLDKLQKEMAALEAVLEQHGSHSPASAAEHVTIRPQEAPEKPADYETYRSPDAIPETEVQSEQGRASGRPSIEQPLTLGSRSRSPTPPLSPPQSTSRRETPEKIRTTFHLLKELKESTLMEDESEGPREDDLLQTHQSDHCAPMATNPKNSKSPKRSLGSKAQEVNGHSMLRRGSARLSTEMEEVVRTPQYPGRRPGNTQRSASPTFESPLRSKFAPSFKSPVVSAQRNFCLVTSGLSQSEVMLVQKFARKTKSVFSSQLTESTTHVVIKTDEQLVCERTLKYFLGVAGRKWVVSYQWIVQSFREGRILDEYDFEVKGDVINGRNHRGPRRSRLGSDGLLLTDFEICCLGSFTDMTRDDLERMVSLCGASVAPDPSWFKHKSGTTCLVVVQPDKETDYAALRKKFRCLPITREWVLDSVSSYKLQAFDGYLV